MKNTKIRFCPFGGANLVPEIFDLLELLNAFRMSIKKNRVFQWFSYNAVLHHCKTIVLVRFDYEKNGNQNKN